MSQIRKDVLNGWKEIAAYLGRDPRTVERWEKQRSLPVRRLPGSGRATVYALTSELDTWLASPSVREPVPSSAAALLPEEVSAQPLMPAPTGHAAPGPVHPAPVAVEPRASRAQARWLRWSAPMVAVVLVGLFGYAAVGWHKGQPLPAATENRLPKPERVRRLVPTSAVPGVEDLYLRGFYQAERRTPESLGRAQEAFRAAIAKDGRYAPAYAGLANTFLLQREYSMMPDAEAYPRALSAADQALTLDPNLPQAYAARGFVDFFWRWNAVAAEQQFRRAMALDADLPLAHHWYGSVLLHEGRFRESAAELGIAQRLDPGSSAILTMRCLAMGLSGGRAEAINLLNDALSRDVAGPDRNPATMHNVLASLSLLPPKNLPRFLAETTLGAELRQDTATVKMMRRATLAYNAGGEQALWRALLHEERARHPTGRPTYLMARYEAELGAKDQALHDLGDLYASHDPALIGISIDPLFATLHREPRFQQLRAAMGLPGMDGE